MKLKYITTLILLLLWIGSMAQDFKVVPRSCKVVWIGYGEIGDFQQTGTIEIANGNITIEGDQIMAGDLEIDMKSIRHEDRSLEKHLKAEDFFNVKKYPSANYSFESCNNNLMEGELSIRGISQLLVFPIAWKLNDDKIVLEAKISIDRTMFDIKYNSSSYFQDLGNYAIKNNVDLDFYLVFEQID